MSLESLPVKLRQLRGTMSLAEAAERSQIPEYRLRMYEEGVRQPYTKTLKRLAEAYGVPVSELLSNGAAPATTAQPLTASTVRRRRRRRRVVAAGGERSVEVPVEVRPGERVRIVIELIVRPAAGQSPPEESAAPAAAPAVTLTTRSGEAADPPPAPRPASLERAPRRALRAPGALAPGRGPARFPQGHAASESGHDASPDARDPLAEFRRAYGEFRRSRRSS
ncbi:MAG TPA: helix-turn-helix transcriptional regulator [Longimicrobiales bacterium]